jgi:succinyl-diaminopimelate desuccinylase
MNIAELCSSLIKIRSENPPGNTVEIIDYIKNFLDAKGVESEVMVGDEDKANLVSLFNNNQLLFCGHVDVVPALSNGWTYDPYSGIEVGELSCGEGTSDMKGGIASILYGVQSLVDKGEEPKVNLLFVCDEETGGEYGIQYIISKHLVKPCDCLVAEPTPPLFPNIGQKGQCKIDLSFRGQPAHGSLYPGVGRSAIMEAFTFIRYLQELNTTIVHGIFFGANCPRGTLNCAEGGER